MQTLDMDFMRPRRGPGRLAWLLLVAGVLSLAVVLLEWQSAQDEWQSAQATAERRARLVQRQRPARPAAPALAPEVVKAGQRVDAALGQPWDRLLSELESLGPAPVALLGLEAQAEGHRVRLTGEARHMPEVVAFVERLRALPSCGSALLVMHESRREGAVDVLRFAVDVDWKVQP